MVNFENPDCVDLVSGLTEPGRICSMQASFKIPVIALAVALFGAAGTASVMAQSARHPLPAGSAQDRQPGYASLSDYVRGIEGIPCGSNCTLAAQQALRHFRSE
jgi:hypothetical protein